MTAKMFIRKRLIFLIFHEKCFEKAVHEKPHLHKSGNKREDHEESWKEQRQRSNKNEQIVISGKPPTW